MSPGRGVTGRNMSPVHPQFFAVNCNNLGISTKEQFRERSRVVAASTAPDGAIPPLPCRGFSPRLLLSRAWEEAFTTRAPGGFGMRMVSFIVKAFLPAKGVHRHGPMGFQFSCITAV